MKFIVDEMPTEPSECPFFISTSRNPVCQYGPGDRRTKPCNFFINGCHDYDCPNLKPLYPKNDD